MQPARIAELLAPFLGDTGDPQLTAGDLDRISTYIDLLLRWNARVNLTAIRDPEQIVTRHFGESLFAARHLFPQRRGRERGRAALQGRVLHENETGALAPALADVGSGAGFPGIPIKLWAPGIHLTLIESNHKKAAFLREAARALTLTNINILTERAETLAATFDVVTLRAVERFETILPIAARLVAPQGRLALLISSTQLPEAKSILVSGPNSEPRWSHSEWHTEPAPLSTQRILAIIQCGQQESTELIKTEEWAK